MRIGDATKMFLRSRGLGDTVALAEIAAIWRETLGPFLAAHASPTALRRHMLVVEVDEPAWATEMQFQSASVLERLSEHLRERAPTELVVRVRRTDRSPGTGPRSRA